MLRRVEHCDLVFSKGVLSRRGTVEFHLGGEALAIARCTTAEFDAALALQCEEPLYLTTVEGRAYWRFRDRYYADTDGLDATEVHALLLTRHHRERARIERAKAILARGGAAGPMPRGVIADDVKQYVFERDGGRCTSCGSLVELQFDHVIPVALGGSSEAENVQILCGPCNRRKGAGLAPT